MARSAGQSSARGLAGHPPPLLPFRFPAYRRPRHNGAMNSDHAMHASPLTATWLGPHAPAWRRLALSAVLLAACTAAQAATNDAAGAAQLTALINAYRAAPGACAGRAAGAAAPLTAQPPLDQLHIASGTFIESALASAGYQAERAEAISISGASDARAAMAYIRHPYCAMLLNPGFSAIGIAHAGVDWTIVLARPAAPPPSRTFPDWRDAGLIILNGVNAARATGRACGEQAFAPAPPVEWNAALGQAALEHSGDMATRRYFDHADQAGGTVAERAQQAGYRWLRIGENIAFGQNMPEEALAGWLASPGHCANIMNPGFTEMGAAYGVSSSGRTGAVYWTQVFGRPR